MKNILGIGFVTAAVFGGSAMGQSARQIDRHVAEMRRYLHLSGKQAGTIRGDYFAASNEKRAIDSNPNLAPYEKEKRVKEVRRSTEQQVEAILSPRQLEAWRNYKFDHPRF